MLHAVGDGETDPAALAALADQRLRVTPEQLRDAFRTRPAVSVEAKKVRTRKISRDLRTLGYRVELLAAPSSNPA